MCYNIYMAKNGPAPENPQFAVVNTLLANYIGALQLAQHMQEYGQEMEEKSKIERVSGLQNLVALEEAYSGLQDAERAERPQRAGDLRQHEHGLILLDLDNFSDINTRYGHQGGNQVFRQVADQIRGSVRGRDVAARITGGDEIAVLLPRVDLEKALEIAEKVRFNVEDGTEVTVSAGVAEVDLDKTLEENLARVDQAAYAAKEQGRNRVVPYTPDLPPVPQIPN